MERRFSSIMVIWIIWGDHSRTPQDFLLQCQEYPKQCLSNAHAYPFFFPFFHSLLNSVAVVVVHAYVRRGVRMAPNWGGRLLPAEGKTIWPRNRVESRLLRLQRKYVRQPKFRGRIDCGSNAKYYSTGRTQGSCRRRKEKGEDAVKEEAF